MIFFSTFPIYNYFKNLFIIKYNILTLAILILQIDFAIHYPYEYVNKFKGLNPHASSLIFSRSKNNFSSLILSFKGINYSCISLSSS